MGRVAMSCEDVRQALPLLPGTHPDDAARVRAHAAGCGGCAELLEAFDADDRALSALRLAPASAPLDGFTAEVMARLAAAPREAEERRPGRAAILRPFAGHPALAEGLPRLAAAAAVLLAVAVGLLVGGPAAVEPDLRATAPAPTPPRQQQTVVEVTPVAATPLAAPRRMPLDRDPAPMPLRRRGPVVPVDEGRRGTRGGAGGGELLEAIEEVLPDFHRRMLKQFGDGRNAREVRF